MDDAITVGFGEGLIPTADPGAVIRQRLAAGRAHDEIRLPGAAVVVAGALEAQVEGPAAVLAAVRVEWCGRWRCMKTTSPACTGSLRGVIFGIASGLIEVP
jgi:hypothetical protein